MFGSITPDPFASELLSGEYKSPSVNFRMTWIAKKRNAAEARELMWWEIIAAEAL
jgi:hypothetical protein